MAEDPVRCSTAVGNHLTYALLATYKCWPDTNPCQRSDSGRFSLFLQTILPAHKICFPVHLARELS